MFQLDWNAVSMQPGGGRSLDREPQISPLVSWVTVATATHSHRVAREGCLGGGGKEVEAVQRRGLVPLTGYWEGWWQSPVTQ